jgi:hypothetical protein
MWRMANMPISSSCRINDNFLFVVKEGLEEKIVIDSAGTGDWHVGHPPHKGTQKILSPWQ